MVVRELLGRTIDSTVFHQPCSLQSVDIRLIRRIGQLSFVFLARPKSPSNPRADGSTALSPREAAMHASNTYRVAASEDTKMYLLEHLLRRQWFLTGEALCLHHERMLSRRPSRHRLDNLNSTS